MAEEPVKKQSKSKKQNEIEKPIFDPRAGLTEAQLALRDQLEELALEYAQNDRERAWLTDMCLLRYLRAREWKLEKAEKMLKATMDWRREWKVDEITRDDVILTLELKSLYRNGVDQEGHPVMFIKPSYNGNTVEYRLKSLIYSLEECIESMDTSQGVEKMTLIADFDTENKLTKKSPDQNTVARQFLSFLQNHYPERLSKAIALNPPWYIRLLYRIISPFMDPVTKKKIHFVNGNADYVKKELLQHIDEDQLETIYGGTRPEDPEVDVRHQRQLRELEVEQASSSPTEGTPKQKKKKSKTTLEVAEQEGTGQTTRSKSKAKVVEEEEASSAPIEEDEEIPQEETPSKKKKSKKTEKAVVDVEAEAVVEVAV